MKNQQLQSTGFYAIILSMFFLLMNVQFSSAQSSANYSFATNTTGSLALDMNSNAIDMSSGTTQLLAPSASDERSALTNLGFNLYFMGKAVSNFSVTDNGIVELAGNTNATTTYLISANTTLYLLAPYASNIRVGTNGDVKYKLFGTAPNRVGVIEYSNMMLNSQAVSDAGNGTFQVRLYETSGVVEYVYGSMVTNAGPQTPVNIGFGINTTTTNFVTVNSSNVANTSGTFAAFTPSNNSNVTHLHSVANGIRRVYRFSPAAAVVATPTTLVFDSVGATSLKLSWNDNSTNELRFTVLNSTDGVNYNLVNQVPSATTGTTGTSYKLILTGLTPSTNYLWRVVANNEGVSSANLSGTQATTAVTTYHWIGTVAVPFTNAANWSPQRNVIDASDILIFDNGGTTSATNFSAQTVAKIVVSNNTNFSLGATAASALTIAGGTGADLDIQTGSSLTLNGAAAITLSFAATGAPHQATIDGTLELATVNTYNTTNAVTTVNGKIAAGASGTSTITGTVSTLFFNAGSTYQHKYTQGQTIPTATWNSASTLLISGNTTGGSPSTGWGQTFGNFTWNCPSQGTAFNWGTSGVPTITGTMSILSTGSVSFGITTSASNTWNVNNFSLVSGTCIVASTTGSPVFKVGGTFSQTGGTFQTTGSGTPVLEFNGTTGAQNVTFLTAAPTGGLGYRVSNPAGVNLFGTGFGTDFNINSGGSVRVATAAAIPINTTLILKYNVTGTTLFYEGTNSMTMTGKEFPATFGPANLTINLTNNAIVTMPFSRSLAPTAANGILTMTSGDIDLGSNNLTLGTTTANPGTLTYTAGLIRVTSGTFTRYFGTTGLPISAGNTGLFPISYGGFDRSANIYFSTATALSTGGTISIGHTSVSGFTTGLSIADGAYTIQRRTNSSWTVSQSGLVATGTIGLRVTGGSLFNTTTVANLRLMQSAGVTATHVAGSGTSPNFRAERSGLSVAQVATSHYIGASDADMPNITYIAINTGNWGTPATWDANAVPTITDNAVILSGVNVSTDGSNVAKSLTINNGGTLTVNTNSLTIDSALTNNGNISIAGGALTINGNSVANAAGIGLTDNTGSTFTITSGTMTIGPLGGSFRRWTHAGGISNTNGGVIKVNGNLVISAGSFYQTAGDISIDGNSGVVGTSVASGVHLFNVSAIAADINFSGGNLIIVDPPFNTIGTGTTRAISIFQNAGSNYFSGTHTVVIGDGLSAEIGNTDGFNIETSANASGKAPLNNLTINAGSATGRWASGSYGSSTTAGTHVKGTLTINSGSEFLTGVFGSEVVLGGNIVNNGTLTADKSIVLGGSGAFVVTNPQTISGSGVFRNAQVVPNANFSGFTVNNSGGISTSGFDFTVSGNILFTLGKISTGSNKINVAGAITATGTTGWINGTLEKNTPTGSAVARTFEVGDANTYAPVSLSFATVSAAGAVAVKTNTPDHPSIGTSNINASKSVNRYWNITSNGGFAFSNASGTLNWDASNLDVGTVTSNFVIAKYDSPNWLVLATSGNTPTSATFSGVNSFSDFQVGELNSFNISATAGANGSVSPSGVVPVTNGTNRTFTITPAACYVIADVLVDGVSVGAVSSYTFTNVTAAHTIAASFSQIQYNIVATASSGGSITPPGTSQVGCGTNLTYTLTPDPCYKIDSVKVNGVNVGTPSTYTFTSISQNSTIDAYFSIITYTITASATSGGTITPSGSVSANCSSNQQFNISASACNNLDSVLVDGVNLGAITTYTFSNVLANHSIAAYFSVIKYTVNATANAGGTISPVGSTIYNCGTSPSYTITPDPCFQIVDVLVDGSSIGAVSSYTFTNIGANHTIQAVFGIISYTITATAGTGGTISPSGAVSVNCGSNQSFTITPTGINVISDVLVDGISQGAITSYTFSNVQANHTIDAQFTDCLSPATVDAGNNSTICAGQNFTLAGSIGGSASSGTWSTSGTGTFSPNNTFAGATQYVPSGADITAGSVTLTLTTDDPAGSCQAVSDFITLTINAIPTASISGTLSFCTGGSTLLTANATAGSGSISNYLWKLNGTSVGINSSTHTATLPGNYTVTVTNSNNCTFESAIATVVENSIPAAPVISAAGPTTFCSGSSVTLNSSYVSGNTWNPGGSTSNSLVVTTANTFTATYTDGNGCVSLPSNSITTTVLFVGASASSNSPVCAGSDINLSSGPSGAVSYSWTGPNSFTSSSQNPTITGAGLAYDGTYSVTVTDNNGCSETIITQVIVSAFPTATITSPCPSLLNSSFVTLTANATAGSGTITNYQWKFNNANTGTNSPTYNATQSGPYTVVVTNSYGCTTESAQYVVIDNNTTLSGTYTIGGSGCNNYATFAGAISDINNVGLSGNVIFEVAAGFTETALTGGLLINQCALPANLQSNSSRTITFQKTGAGANPIITAGTGLGSNDAVVILQGVDYVTFDGIDIQSNAANITSTTQAEHGYLITNCSGTNGAQNNTIRNCAISLNKTNSNQTNGVAIINSGVTVTAASGTNSNNQVYSNTISNCFNGVNLIGYNSSIAPYSFYDQNNEVGKTGLGNTISDFGNATSTSAAFGIHSIYNSGLKVISNSINSGGGAAHRASIRGIGCETANWANVDIQNNTVTVSVAAGGDITSTCYGIMNSSGSRISRFDAVSNTINVIGNTVTNCNYPSADTGSFYAIYNVTPGTDSLTGATVNINNNQILNNISASNTQLNIGMAAIFAQATSNVSNISGNTISGNNYTGTNACANRGIVTGFGKGLLPNWQQIINLDGNIVTNNNSNTSTATAGGTIGCIEVETYGGSAAIGAEVNMTNNRVGTMTQSLSISGTYSGITTTASTNIQVTINNNTLSNVTRSTMTGAFNGIRSTGSARLVTMNGNILKDVNTNSTASTVAINGITSTGNSTLTLSLTMDSDTVMNFTGGSNGQMTCLDAGSSVDYLINSCLVTGNTHTGTAGNFRGISVTGSTSTGFSDLVATNNIVTNNIQSNSTTGTTVLFNTGGANTYVITGNRVQNNQHTGSTSLMTLFDNSSSDESATTSLIFSNNIGSDNTMTSSGTATLTHVANLAGTSLTIANNQFYNNSKSSATGTIVGYGISGPVTGTVDFNHNSFHDIGFTATSGTTVATFTPYVNTTSPNESVTDNEFYNLYINGSNTGASNLTVLSMLNSNNTGVRNVTRNIIRDISSQAVSSVQGIAVNGGTNNIYGNKIYKLTMSAATTSTSITIAGITLAAGTPSTNIYNNFIGDLITPAIGSVNQVRGINLLGTLTGLEINLYNNTIYMNATSTGTNFGSSGVFHTFNATSTSGTLRMKNNIIYNSSVPKGTGSTVAFRRSGTAVGNLGNLGDCDNNIFYAGAPGPANLIFSDGTNVDQAMSTYKTRVSPREVYSQSENVPFLSTTPTSTDYLKINTAIATAVESGGQPINIPSITTDYFGTTRNTLTPDIGAHEGSFLTNALKITSVSAVPVDTQCTATARLVTAVVVPGTTAPLTVTLNYSFNNGAVSTVTMTNTPSTNNWTATIPAATPANASVAWFVKASDLLYNRFASGPSYQDSYLTNSRLTSTSSPAFGCDGGITTLTAASTNQGSNLIGEFTKNMTAGPYRVTSTSVKTQILYQASELIAAGYVAGPITAIGFRMVTGGPTMNNVIISLKNTSTTSVNQNGTPTPLETGFTQVYTAASFTPTVGLNVHQFTTPFTWDGVSNLFIEFCFTNPATFSTSGTMEASTTIPAVTIQQATSGCAATNSANTIADRPVLYILGSRTATNYSYTWTGSPAGHGLTSNTGSTTTAVPTAPVPYTYTVTATDARGCTMTSSVEVNTNASPASLTANNSNQCGTHIPTCSITGANSNVVRWYLTASGGAPIQNTTDTILTSYSVSATTTFYVSRYNGTCESARVPVIANVTTPDLITASSTTPACPNYPLSLSSSQSGSTNSYTYSWTAIPSAGSGLSGSQGGQNISVTPTVPGTYSFVITATDGFCVTTDTEVVVVNSPPTITSISATPPTVCVNSTTTLNATSFGVGYKTEKIGTGFVTNSYDGPYRRFYGGGRLQSLYLASELTALGFQAGYINSLAYIVTKNPTGTTTMLNVSMALKNTSISVLNLTFQTGLTTVYNAASFTPVIGINTHTFNTPFYWDGTSNLLVEYCFNNNSGYGSSVETEATAITGSNMTYSQAANFTPNICTTPTGGSSTSRPNIYLNATAIVDLSASRTWVWNPGNLSGQTVTPTVTANTTYIVSATSMTNGCTSTQSVAVTVNQQTAAPVPHDSTQCGIGVPTCHVTGQGGDFAWYLQPTGGTAIANEIDSVLHNYSINTTTTFYVGEWDGSCVGLRTPIVASVSYPDAVTALASSAQVCPNGALTLSVTQTGTTNNYLYSWSASPTTGSGISTPVSGSPVIVYPTVSGNYVYTVSATDGSLSCATNSTVSVTVLIAPAITTLTANPPTVCAGSNVSLSATSYTYPPTIFNSTGSPAINGSIDGPYQSGRNVGWGIKNQYLYTAAELNALGIAPGPITSIGFTVAGTGSGTVPQFEIAMALTSATALGTNFINTGLVTVFGPTTYTPTLNALNTHTLTAPFIWDGTSSLIVQICHQMPIPLGSSYYVQVQSGVTSITLANTGVTCASSTGTLSPKRPITTFGATLNNNVTNSRTWTWNPGNLTGASVNVNPIVTTTYTVSATDPSNGCSTSNTITVNVNAIPATPTVTDGLVCGSGIPDNQVTGGGGGGSFIWYLSPTGIDSIPGEHGTQLVNYVISTTTTFWVAEWNGTCESQRFQTITHVDQPDPITASVNDTTICKGDTIQLGVTQTGSTLHYDYFWSASPAIGSGLPSGGTGANLVVVPTIPGTYTYSVSGIDPTIECIPVSTVTVVMNDVPLINSVSANPPALCSSGSTTLTATVTTNSQILRNFGTGTSSTSLTWGNPFYESEEGSRVQYLIKKTELDAAGIEPGDMKALSFYINTLGTTVVPLNGYTIKIAHSTLTDLQTTFENGAFTTVKGPFSYTPVVGTNSFNFDTPFNWNGTSNIVINICYDNDPTGNCSSTVGVCVGNAATTYFYTTTSFISCRGFADENVAGIRDVCSMSATGFTYTDDRPNMTLSGNKVIQSAGTYNWLWNPGSLAGNIVTANPTATTTYVVTATETAHSCTATGSVTVTMNTAPVTPIVTSNVDEICNSGSFVLSISNPVGGASIQWQESTNGTTWTNIASANGVTYTTPPLFATKYYRVYINCVTSDTSAAKAVVVLVPGFTSINPGSHCGAGTVTLSVTGNATYDWYSASTGGTLLFTGPVFTPTISTTTNYFVQARIGSCISSGGRQLVTATITTPPGVTISSSASTDTVCNGSALTLTAVSANPGYKYTWSIGATTVGTGSPFTTYPSASATYQLTALDTTSGTNQGCTITVTKAIGVNPVPPAPVVSPPNASICTIGGSATLTVTNPSNPLVWSPGGQTTASITVSPTTTTTYTVSSFLPTGCSASTTVLVTYDPVTTPVISYTGSNTICPGGTITLDAGTGYASYSWSDGSTVVGSGQLYAASPGSTTTYTVTVSNGGPCTATASQEVIVAALTPPTITTSTGSATVCQGSSVDLNAGAGYTTYSWSDGSNVISTTQFVTVTSAGNYTVTVSNGGPCTASASQAITVNPSPAAPVVTWVGPLTLCDDNRNSLVLTADTTGAGPNVLLEWNNFDQTSGTNTVTIFGDDLRFLFNSNPYDFFLTVTNSYNCNSFSNAVTVTSVTCPPPQNDTLDVRVLIEGYYAQNGMMDNFGQGGCLSMSGVSGASLTDADTLRVNLVDSATHAVAFSQKGIMKTDGHIKLAMPSNVIGNRYYIQLLHRNAIETWSANTVLITSSTTSYNFTTAANKAYGSNQIQSFDGFWLIFSGDISDANELGLGLGYQDEVVEASDYLDMENAVAQIKFGYVVEDITGDGVVEAFDYLLMENNVGAIRFSIHP